MTITELVKQKLVPQGDKMIRAHALRGRLPNAHKVTTPALVYWELDDGDIQALKNIAKSRNGYK